MIQGNIKDLIEKGFYKRLFKCINIQKAYFLLEVITRISRITAYDLAKAPRPLGK